MRIHLDTETRSRVSLKDDGVYAYTACPGFSVLILTWSVDGAPVQLTTDAAEITSLLRTWLLLGADLVAHNAAFDRVVCSEHLRRAGFLAPGEYLDPAQWDCTSRRAAEWAYPSSLANCARYLGCAPKDEAGKDLLRLFTRPVSSGKRKGQWNDAATHPEQWAAFCAYAVTDTRVLVEVDAKVPGWPTPVERQAYVLDQRINDAGLPIDVSMAELAAAAHADNTVRMKETLRLLTGIDNPGSVQQVTAFLAECGVEVPNLKADTVTRLLVDPDLDPMARTVLEARQELALSAASKFGAALDVVSADGRCRGGFQFFGAHTGRFAGRKPQFQNQPREAFKADPWVDDADADAQAAVKVETAILDLRLGLGASPLTLKRLVRPMFLGPFTVVDFAQIEARVAAWVADETWALEAFEAGRDLHTETSEMMTRATGQTFTRQQGKTSNLACSFAGGVGAMRRMGAEGDDEELQGIVDAWRAANPSIARFWKRLQESIEQGGRPGARTAVTRRGNSMRLHLPSGRAISYHGLRVETYRVPDPEDPEQTIRKTSWRYQDPNTPRRIGLWRGLLMENLCQAIARDLLVQAMLRLDERGYPVIAHAHDEVVLEGEHDLDEIIKIVCEPPSWAQGLPIGAEGYVGLRYRK